MIFDCSESVLDHIKLNHPKAYRRRLRSEEPPERIFFRTFLGSTAGEEYPNEASPVVTSKPPPIRIPKTSTVPSLMSLGEVGGPHFGSTSSSSAIKVDHIMGSGDAPSSTGSKTLVIDGVDGDNLRYHWIDIPNLAPSSNESKMPAKSYASMVSQVPSGSFSQASSESAKRNANRKRARVAATQGNPIVRTGSTDKISTVSSGSNNRNSTTPARAPGPSSSPKRRKEVTDTIQSPKLVPWRDGKRPIPVNCGCNLPFVSEQERSRHMHAVHTVKFQTYICTVCKCHFPASRDFIGHILPIHREEVSKGIYPEPAAFSRFSGETDRFLSLILGSYTCIPFCRLCGFAHFELYSRNLGCWCMSRRPTPGEPHDYHGPPSGDILPLSASVMFPKETIPHSYTCSGPGCPFVPPPSKLPVALRSIQS